MSNIGLWIIIVKVFSLTIAYVYPALLQYRDSSHPRRFLLLVISYYDRCWWYCSPTLGEHHLDTLWEWHLFGRLTIVTLSLSSSSSFVVGCLLTRPTKTIFVNMVSINCSCKSTSPLPPLLNYIFKRQSCLERSQADLVSASRISELYFLHCLFSGPSQRFGRSQELINHCC